MIAIKKIFLKLKTIFFDLHKSVIFSCIVVGFITYLIKLFLQLSLTDITYQYTIRFLSVLTTAIGTVLILKAKNINIVFVCLCMIVIGLVLTYG